MAHFNLNSLCSVLSFGQTYSEIIDDQDIIDFLNEILKSDNFENSSPRKNKLLVSSIVKWQNSSFVKKSRDELQSTPKPMGSGYLFNQVSDTLISIADIDYFLKQTMQQKASRWKNHFYNTRLIRKSNSDQAFKYSYSIPLFNADKSKAIIYKGFIKDRLTRGFGYYLYRKVNGKWVLLEPLFQIQS